MVKIIDDTEIFEPFISPVCTYCDRLHREQGTKTCEAFPEGIPNLIWMGENKHLTPFAGDKGLTFKLSALVSKENQPEWIII
jgi:hypothetical protein